MGLSLGNQELFLQVNHKVLRPIACLGFLRQVKRDLYLVTLASLSSGILGKLYLLLLLLLCLSVCLYFFQSPKEHLLHDQEKLKGLNKGRVVLRNCLLSFKTKKQKKLL